MLYTLFVVYYLWGGGLFVCLFTLSQYVTLADLEPTGRPGWPQIWKDMQACFAGVLGWKLCGTTPGSIFFFPLRQCL